jgi:hypothetical protein
MQAALFSARRLLQPLVLSRVAFERLAAASGRPLGGTGHISHGVLACMEEPPRPARRTYIPKADGLEVESHGAIPFLLCAGPTTTWIRGKVPQLAPPARLTHHLMR